MRLYLRMTAGLLAAATSIWLAPAIGAQRSPASELPVRHIDEIPAERIQWQFDRTLRVPLADPEKIVPLGDVPPGERSRANFATLIDTTAIDPSLLTLAGITAIGIGGMPPARRASHVSFSLDGQDLTLYVVESLFDAERVLRQVLAAIVEEPGSYARFTIDNVRPNASGFLAATVKIRKGEYRIVSRPNGGGELVYRLRATNPSARLGKVADTKWENIARIERRHTQAELLADIQPENVSMARNDLTVRVQGGDLGSIKDPDNIVAAEVCEVLVRFAPLTNALGSESLLITSVSGRGRDTDHEVRFRQVLNGIPVERPNSLVIDRGGRIKVLTVSLIDPERISVMSPAITEDVARRNAMLRTAQLLQISSDNVVFQGPAEIVYELGPGPGGLELTPVWRFALVGDRRPMQARVNAVSGDARVLDGMIR